MKLLETIKLNKEIDDEESVAINILYTAYVLKSALNGILKQYALSVEQYNVLRILKSASPGKMCVKQIANRLIERNANVPRTIDKLVDKRLAKRSTSLLDKRETVSEISVAGIKMLETVTPLIEASLREKCGLDKTGLAKLNTLLDKYRKGI